MSWIDLNTICATYPVCFIYTIVEYNNKTQRHATVHFALIVGLGDAQ